MRHEALEKLHARYAERQRRTVEERENTQLRVRAAHGHAVDRLVALHAKCRNHAARLDEAKRNPNRFAARETLFQKVRTVLDAFEFRNDVGLDPRRGLEPQGGLLFAAQKECRRVGVESALRTFDKALERLVHRALMRKKARRTVEIFELTILHFERLGLVGHLPFEVVV